MVATIFLAATSMRDTLAPSAFATSAISTDPDGAAAIEAGAQPMIRSIAGIAITERITGTPFDGVGASRGQPAGSMALQVGASTGRCRGRAPSASISQSG